MPTSAVNIKSHLDFLYDRRSKLLADIEKRKEMDKGPKPYCDKCKSTCDENRAVLQSKQDEFISLDQIIHNYLEIHVTK